MRSKLTSDGFDTKIWKLPNGSLHREDGPALEYKNGDKFWYINGKRHKENGPAMEWANGSGKQWYLNGINYTEQEYKKKMRSIKLKLLL